MQNNETIIDQFVKTIKESPLEVSGDPVLLNNIFLELEKKKKRRLFNIFILAGFAVIALCFVVWGVSSPNKQIKESKSMIEPTNQLVAKIPQPAIIIATADVVEKNNVATTKKANKTTAKKEEADFTNVVSYKFNNHQVDVFENGGQEFIQINVFGADGVEQDVLKIMEDLKKSYKKNEVYVDSVKHK